MYDGVHYHNTIRPPPARHPENLGWTCFIEIKDFCVAIETHKTFMQLPQRRGVNFKGQEDIRVRMKTIQAQSSLPCPLAVFGASMRCSQEYEALCIVGDISIVVMLCSGLDKCLQPSVMKSFGFRKNQQLTSLTTSPPYEWQRKIMGRTDSYLLSVQ